MIIHESVVWNFPLTVYPNFEQSYFSKRSTGWSLLELVRKKSQSLAQSDGITAAPNEGIARSSLKTKMGMLK